MIVPAPLMVSEPGSFAEYTIVKRKPQILADVIEHNDYSPEIVEGIRAFADEIASCAVAFLDDNGSLENPECAADVAQWRESWLPWCGRTWRQVSWYFAETFFYRRLLQVVRYDVPGPWFHVDPFEPQKLAELARGLGTLARLCAATPEGLGQQEQFRLLVGRCLWGNRADLSNLGTRERAHDAMHGDDESRLLVDHRDALWMRVAAAGTRRIDWVCDNSGLELLNDLVLIDMLLAQGLVSLVRMWVKPRPFFVSDAMAKDVSATIAALQAHDDRGLSALGQRLAAYRDDGRLAVDTHPFFTCALHYRAMPDDLRETMSACDLIVLKGDVNYRRLLDDGHWPHTADLAEIAAYMPRSFVSLRTLKGEIMVGLAQGVAERLAAEDPRWLISGERGLIHLVCLD